MEDKKNHFEFITTTILGLLQGEKVPWVFPYEESSCQASSFQTKKEYSLFNKLLILAQTGRNGGEYVGEKFIQKNNYTLKDGAKSISIVFSMPPHYQTDKNDEKKWYGGFSKNLPVYNINDVVGLSENYKPSENKRFKNADEVVKSYLKKTNISIVHSNETPNFVPDRDEVTIPCKDKFRTETDYYKVLFHELIHSTQKKERCNRTSAVFTKDKDEYAAEELVAEIGSAYLSSLCGLPNYLGTIQNTAEYCRGWYEKLNQVPALFMRASKEAEKAVKYITVDCAD